jgi:hypothetical protein
MKEKKEREKKTQPNENKLDEGKQQQQKHLYFCWREVLTVSSDLVQVRPSFPSCHGNNFRRSKLHL